MDQHEDRTHWANARGNIWRNWRSRSGEWIEDLIDGGSDLGRRGLFASRGFVKHKDHAVNASLNTRMAAAKREIEDIGEQQG